MKKYIIIQVLLLISTQYMIGQAQLGQSWVIGVKGYKVKFTGNNIVHDTSYIGTVAPREFPLSKTNICDSNGNLRYASNGQSIFHPDGSFVENADSLEYNKLLFLASGGGKMQVKSVYSYRCKTIKFILCQQI